MPFNPNPVHQELQRLGRGYKAHLVQPVQTDVLVSDVVTAQNMDSLRQKLEEETQSLGNACKLRRQKAFNAAGKPFCWTCNFGSIAV